MERLIEDVRTYIIDQLKDDQSWIEHQAKKEQAFVDAGHINELTTESIYYDMKGDDLPDYLLNNNYFIIGTYKAKQWLGVDALSAVQKISEYETENFGEVYTDLSDPEKIANMISYILGNELLNSVESLRVRNDTFLSKYTIQLIINELELRKESNN